MGRGIRETRPRQDALRRRRQVRGTVVQERQTRQGHLRLGEVGAPPPFNLPPVSLADVSDASPVQPSLIVFHPTFAPAATGTLAIGERESGMDMACTHRRRAIIIAASGNTTAATERGCGSVLTTSYMRVRTPHRSLWFVCSRSAKGTTSEARPKVSAR